MININLKEIKRTQPKNETEIHNTLKEIGKYILFNQGCRIIATEVDDMYGFDDNIRKSIMTCGLKPITDNTNENIKDLIEYNGKYFKVPKSRILPVRNKHISDVVGIKIRNCYTPSKRSYEVISIEAKASLSDFKNGFCYGAEKNYVIAPVGIIPKEYLHKDIGLIEVDLDKFKIINGNKAIEFQGVSIVKSAKKRLDERFENKETYQKWASQLVFAVGKRCTNELLFWNNSVPLYKKKGGRSKTDNDDISEIF